MKIPLVVSCLCSTVFIGGHFSSLRAETHTARGFERFYNLEYDEAIADFESGIALEPAAPGLRNHLAQALLFREMFRAGALESEMVTGSNPFLRREKLEPSPEVQTRILALLDEAARLARNQIARDAGNTRALYQLGVTHGLRANFLFIVRKAWMESLREATAGRKLHNRVTELDPKFTDARLMQGMHDYVIGSLPWTWKLLGFLAGYRGNKDEGIRTVRQVAAEGDLNRRDAAILLAIIYRRERRPREAVPLLEELIRVFPRNYLFRLELVQMYSDLIEKQKALDVLAELESRKRSGEAGYKRMPIEKVYFSRGTLQFWYRDFEAAVGNFRRVAARADDMDLNTALMTWMRLGQLHDLLGRRVEAQAAYRNAVALAPQSEVAKECRGYLRSPYRRKKS
ncbi:MAG: tetratricopeptide repeat protein [Bryobacteraceae bacterium]